MVVVPPDRDLQRVPERVDREGSQKILRVALDRPLGDEMKHQSIRQHDCATKRFPAILPGQEAADTAR
jgi:hypothetical protein